jgi:quercetin dioxygenase-like cupin family protein
MSLKHFIANIAEIPWEQYPGHFGGALSKALVQPKTCGSKLIDFRISTYQPMAYVAEHVHKVQEQVYFVLEGEGVLTLGPERRVMRRHDYAFMPPGLPHSFTNTGLGPLVFLVVTTPVDDNEVPL